MYIVCNWSAVPVLGVTQSEAEDALGRVEGWYEYYVARDFTPAEAFHKVVLRWPDAFFDCYSFPKVSYIVDGKVSICSATAQ